MLVFGLIVGLIALLIGVPIFAVFVLGAGIPLFYDLNVPLSALSNLCVGAINKYVLLAIPLFVMAGHLLTQGGAVKRIIDFLMAVFGHLPGGLAIIAVLASAFFGACAGSSLAVIVAVGTIMIPIMEKYGYSKAFSAGLLSVSGILGLIIPPSNGYIIYGAITGTSISKLFIAGIVPGLILTLALCAVAVIICRRRFEVLPRASWIEIRTTFVRALPSLCVPIVVLGVIYGGIATPTEAAAVACAAGVILGLIHRQLTWQSLMDSFIKTAYAVGIIFILIATAIFLSSMFSYYKIPQNLTTWMMGTGLNPVMFLFMASVLALILGTFIEAVPMAYITLPILFPMAAALNINPLFYGVLSTVFAGGGQITPPVGVGLYTAAATSGAPTQDVLKEAMPFFITWVVVGCILIFFPGLCSWLPAIMVGA